MSQQPCFSFPRRAHAYRGGLGSCHHVQPDPSGDFRPRLPPAPSEAGPKSAERGGSALLSSVAKITLKASPAYYLNLV